LRRIWSALDDDPVNQLNDRDLVSIFSLQPIMFV